ncbi:uncharacterized protein C8Q71DRAFT_831333 [Rhodofomes roseus]|uniref:Uncharacterized protein n=1 Tax=Rhodofomes roseus TaxID=34475 RepID=A0ABQ8KLC2_9APHY|nr:uncharacterized protein C8Q71DRAFT_831333 [Rhodofomes roseus]KAH9839070.1 hypothetical protein C8Q71DRAFT_831333 [Rhodofomes roseus]
MAAASCLASVFACCLRRSRSSSPGRESLDERTHLIPPTSDEPSPEPYVVDQQQLNARLGPIVRAKEGCVLPSSLPRLQTHRRRHRVHTTLHRKMVNVNTPLPFNLHNRPLHDPSGSATRSRSASAHLEPATQRRVSYSPPREPSVSPSIPTSRSTSSLQPGDASYLPPEADPEYGCRPVLNVRLVRGAPGNGIWTRRGRSVTRGRYSRFGDDGSAARQGQQEQKVWDGNGEANSDAASPMATEGNGREHDKEGNGVVREDGQEADDAAESTPHPPIGGSPTDTEGETAAPDFRIEITDVGKISQSWGD